ncbi:MAG: DUF4230 domain-containing protein [Anaerolineales bacterium]|nr:MAG: DUF4230 domain-containing protein [Anaerolineales bacterium]
MLKKISLNTVILVVMAFILIAGVVGVIISIRLMTSPLEDAQRVLEEKLAELISTTPTVIPDQVTIVREVQGLSRLETAVYTVEKVITAESGQGPLAFLFGDRLLLVAHGQVIAGVALGSLTAEDVSVSQAGTVVIRLPETEVLLVSLNNEESYNYDRETGIIGLNPDLETAARQAAEQEILDAALEDGILEMAQDYAELHVRRLVLVLGFEEVRFSEQLPEPTDTPTPTPTPEPTATP